MKIYKISNDTGSPIDKITEHFCYYCKSHLNHIRFKKHGNTRLFPNSRVWGLSFECNCGESNIWTYAILDRQTLRNIIKNLSEFDRSSQPSTSQSVDQTLFCKCGQDIQKIGEVVIDRNGEVAAFEPQDEKFYYFNDKNEFDRFIRMITLRDLNETMAVSEDMSVEKMDVYGCARLHHNTGILRPSGPSGYASGKKILEWMGEHMNSMPTEMIKDLSLLQGLTNRPIIPSDF